MPAPVRRSPTLRPPGKRPHRSLIGAATSTGLILALVLAGCSSGNDADPAGAAASAEATGTAGAVGSTEAAETDPDAGLIEGSELKQALLTKQDLPSGFTVSTELTNDSADGFGPKFKKVAPTKASCKNLDTNVWINGAGIHSAAFAQTKFSDRSGLEIHTEIDSYRGTDATKVMSNLRKLFSVCAAYKTTTPGAGKSTVKVTSKTGPKVGDASTRAVLTSPAWADGSTLIAVRSGQSVVTVLYSSAQGTAGDKAAKYAETMVKRLTEDA